jgi:hypothetical protein
MHPQGVVSTVLIVMGVAILLFENSLSVEFIIKHPSKVIVLFPFFRH